MQTLYYDTKNTSATTTYVAFKPDDKTTLLNSLMSINNWMQEMSVAKDKDIKMFTKWYNTSNKKFLYNSKLKTNNSPQSIIAGTLNNILWGKQMDFSLVQLEVLQEINNTCIDIIEVIMDEKQITLQQVPQFQKLWLEENLWIS